MFDFIANWKGKSLNFVKKKGFFSFLSQFIQKKDIYASGLEF